MKCLSIRQPWVAAIMFLGKDVENRTWATTHRGPLLIHAAQRIEREIAHDLHLDPDELVTGALVGVIDVVDCVRDYRSRWAIHGQWHWVLSNPRLLPRPRPYLGRLSLFDVPLQPTQTLAPHRLVAARDTQTRLLVCQ